jgi:hypothetical protein
MSVTTAHRVSAEAVEDAGGRWLTLPERHPGRVIAAIGLLFALAYASSLILLAKPDGRIVIGDAVHYYVYLRSAVFDGDLQFRNEYVRLYGLRGGEPETEWIYQPTATGHTRNVMSIGPAIVWAPLYLIVTALMWTAHAIGGGAAPDGYARAFQASAGLSGVLAATLGAYAAFIAAARLFGARAAIWSTLAMWLGGSAIYYSLVSPTYSHAASMLTVGLFVAVWIRTLDRQTVARYAIVGALGGLATLVRWQDAVLLIIPAIDAVWSGVARPPVRPGRVLLHLVICGLSAIVVFSPQMLVWWTLYGNPFLVPQGEDFMHWGSPALGSVLFSSWHGLLTWTPIVAASLVGLVLLARRAPLVGVALIVAFLVAFYTNAAVADWWAGEAFGSRRFVSCFPILVIGLAALISSLDARLGLRALVTIIAVVIIYNGLLLLQYQTFMHGLRTIAPYPGGYVDLYLMRFIVPFRLVAWWLR